jgi:hypothetical protein
LEKCDKLPVNLAEFQPPGAPSEWRWRDVASVECTMVTTAETGAHGTGRLQVVHTPGELSMRWIILSIGALLAGASLTWAFDEPKKKPTAKEPPAANEVQEKGVAEQIEAVQAELAGAQQELIKEYQAANDDEEKSKIVERFHKLQADTVAKYLAIVKEHPDDAAMLPALQAIIAFGDNASLAGRQGAEKVLRTVAEKSKSRDAKGLSLLALGQMLFGQSGEDGMDDQQRAKLREQAEEALQAVVNDYANVNTDRGSASDMAERLLYEVKHLAIGLEVPDLEGKDLDDTVFKLSDYRGKVVFLDFWAHW